MDSAPPKVTAGLVAFLVLAAAAGVFAILRPEVLHKYTADAYTRGPLRKIKPLADWHRDKRQVGLIRIAGILVLAIVVWVTILIIRNR